MDETRAKLDAIIDAEIKAEPIRQKIEELQRQLASVEEAVNRAHSWLRNKGGVEDGTIYRGKVWFWRDGNIVVSPINQLDSPLGTINDLEFGTPDEYSSQLDESGEFGSVESLPY